MYNEKDHSSEENASLEKGVSYDTTGPVGAAGTVTE